MKAPPGPYGERDARAARLAGERPHAAEVLSLYRRVLAAQRPRFERVASSRWLEGRPGRRTPEPDAGFGPAGATGAPSHGSLGLAGLPFTKLVRPLRRFATEVAENAPDTLSAAGASVASAPAGALETLLERTATLGSLDEVAAAVGAEVLPVLFYARSFLQPIAEGLAAREAAGDGPPGGGGNGRPGSRPADGAAEREAPAACPRCGWPPQVALLRDEPDAKGRELLACGLCGTAWPFPRLRCPSCGETASDRLLFHVNEDEPYLQVAECSSCRAYVKTVDLRRLGTAVPVVEDLASPELDVWADERGLWKISRNLFGM